MAVKKLLFYFGHPAQYLFAREAIKNLKALGHTIFILIKSKDVLEQLVISDGFEYENILPEGRADNLLGILIGVLKRELRIFHYVRNRKINLMIGTDPTIAHVGKLLRIPVITTLEDDYEVIPKLARLTFPFTSYILAPSVCHVSKRFEGKKLPYNGYMKLAYLHPNYFEPIRNLAAPSDKPYIFIRFAKLTAHHDTGIKGLNISVIDKINQLAEDRYKVIINTEYSLPPKYEHQCLNFEPANIHHVLYFADLFISDSQSMSVEASMLGVPSIRYSSFAGKISVLNELEYKYELTHSIQPPAEDKLLSLIETLINIKRLKREYQLKREKMLNEKVDVTKLFTELIDRYPESLEDFYSQDSLKK